MEERGNLPEVSVSELSGAIKRTLEDAFGYVRVRGEVSGYRGAHGSGHVYFALKDERARLEAVIWKGVFARLKVRPEEGLEVIATGKVSSFPGSSKYQLVIEALEPAGLGALLLQLDERRRRLAAEGLFDAARKRPLPYLPEVIGVVTSPTGAVIRDILHRLADRFPRRVVLWPVRVQGETSAAEVAAAVRGFGALPADGAIPRPDVIIVARGGGSIEDLWGFNDEAVVRAVAACPIPVIAAVGHETDTTLIDLVADRRAPTPTAAAEMAVPVRSDLLASLAELGARQRGALLRLGRQRRDALRALERALPRPEDMLLASRQRLDLTGQRLPGALRAGLDQRSLGLGRLRERMERRSPRVALAERRVRLEGTAMRLHNAYGNRLAALAEGTRRHRQTIADLDTRLAAALRRNLQRAAETLAGRLAVLEALSHRGVLARGYALVRDERGQPLRSAHAARPGSRLAVEMADGRLRVTVEGGRAQADLFDA